MKANPQYLLCSYAGGIDERLEIELSRCIPHDVPSRRAPTDEENELHLADVRATRKLEWSHVIDAIDDWAHVAYAELEERMAAPDLRRGERSAMVNEFAKVNGFSPHAVWCKLSQRRKAYLDSINAASLTGSANSQQRADNAGSSADTADTNCSIVTPPAAFVLHIQPG